MTHWKITENRLRETAKRQGLIMQKSRRRDPRATTYGTYHLTDAQTGALVAWGSSEGYGLSLDEIESALHETDRREILSMMNDQ